LGNISLTEEDVIILLQLERVKRKKKKKWCKSLAFPHMVEKPQEDRSFSWLICSNLESFP
jgi:hypothetical protein